MGQCHKLWAAGLILFNFCGCQSYKEVVRPVTRMSVLSPDLENLTEAKIESYLKANVKPSWPTTLAVGKLSMNYSGEPNGLDAIHGDEAEGWRTMTDIKDASGRQMIEQVHFLSTMLVGKEVTLKNLRDAAALVHAPLLLVYLQADDHREGYNSAGMAYWTIVGLFTVPGNTVGQFSVCQAILVDTRTGLVLATIQGESKREENVLYGAVNIARDRIETQTQKEAANQLQNSFRKTIEELK